MPVAGLPQTAPPASIAPTTRTQLLPLLAASVTVILWASSFVVIRATGDTFSPGSMALLRMLAATVVLSVVMGALMWRRGIPPVLRAATPAARRALGLVALYGAAWFGVYTVVLNWAEQHLDAGTAALLVNIAPIIVAVYAGAFMGDGFSPPLVIGIVIAFTGVVLITVGGSGAHASRLGIALGVLAAILYATGVLVQKVALRTVDALTATWLGALVGLLVTLPFAAQAWTEASAATTAQLGAVIYLGVGPTALAFLTWAYALARTAAGPMAATTLVVPALVILASWWLLGEIPTSLGLVGGAMCLIGVAVSRRRRFARRRSARYRQ